MSTPLASPIEVVDGGLVIRRRWATASDLITILGIGLIDGVGISLLVASGLRTWALVAGVVAVAATYAAIARLVNWTIVVVTSEGIEIVVKPVPWPGARSIARADITEIRCSEQPLKWDFGGLSSHAVIAQTREGPVTLYSSNERDSVSTTSIAARIREKLGADEPRPVELLEDVGRAG